MSVKRRGYRSCRTPIICDLLRRTKAPPRRSLTPRRCRQSALRARIPAGRVRIGTSHAVESLLLRGIARGSVLCLNLLFRSAACQRHATRQRRYSKRSRKEHLVCCTLRERPTLGRGVGPSVPESATCERDTQ